MIPKNLMRTLGCVLLLWLSTICMAQDLEFPDYRSKKDNFTKMREKDIRFDLASFTYAGIDESMGKGPLKAIPVTNFGSNFMKFEGNNIQVIISAGVFNPAKHKLAYYEEKHLVKIDAKPFFGNYGKIPRTTIESVVVVVGKDTVSIPTTAFYDLYNPSFAYTDASGTPKSHNAVYFSPDKSKIYIYMLNKEAVGSYEVTWVIQDKSYLRRVLDFGLLK